VACAEIERVGTVLGRGPDVLEVAACDIDPYSVSHPEAIGARQELDLEFIDLAGLDE